MILKISKYCYQNDEWIDHLMELDECFERYATFPNGCLIWREAFQIKEIEDILSIDANQTVYFT
jgi:hypothetical protein